MRSLRRSVCQPGALVALHIGSPAEMAKIRPVTHLNVQRQEG